jgi:hypothetical protein
VLLSHLDRMEWTAKEITTLIVSATTVVGTIVVALIQHKKKRSTEQNASVAQPLVVIQNSSLPQSSAPVLQRVVEHSPTAKRARPFVTEVSHKEIVEKLRSLNPYHQGLIEKSYVGLRVRWRVLLTSLDERTSGKGNVHGNVADTKTAIDCDGLMTDFVCLIHAGDGEEIEVEGTIELVSTAYTILEDCLARRLKQPA